MGAYLDWLGATDGLAFEDYDALWRWSTDDPDAFWRSLWGFFEVSSTTPSVGLANGRMPGASWFPGATLNYAAQALRVPGRRDDDVVVLPLRRST